MHSDTQRVLREMAQVGKKIADLDCGPKIAERAVSYLAALNELVDEPPVLLEQGPRVEEILGLVCHQLHLDQAELLGRSRTQRVVNIRFVAMYLVKKMTPMSYPEIGRLFGRDHSTVLYGVKQIEKRVLQVPKFGMTLEKMRRELVATPLVEAAA